MHALATARPFRNLAMIVPVLVLAACGQGSGPDSIVNQPATPLPPVPPDFCDAINFELACQDPAFVNFNGGASIVVENPDKTGLNASDRVVRMQKFPDEVFGGTRLDLAEAIDFTEGESYLVKIWSPRPVTVLFKLEELGNPAGGLAVEQDHSGSGSWEELCFDFTGQNVPPPVVGLTIIFDNGTLGQADTDPDNWTFYYDDIKQVQSCAGSSGPPPIDPDAAIYRTEGEPDFVLGADYEQTAFGSGSVIDRLYADDETFSPVLSVFSGAGYGANVAQVGFIAFEAGFLGAYETIDFKVKGMPNEVIFVKLFDGVDALRISLTRPDSSFAGDLGDGWYQVSIPVSRFSGADQATGIVFESDDSAAQQFRMLLTDIGFSGEGDNPPPGAADPGIAPDTVIYAADGSAPDLDPIYDPFGSGSAFATVVDSSFANALEVTVGVGYGGGALAQLGLTQLAPGFASGFGEFVFKVKGLTADNTLLVKFEAGGGAEVQVDLTAPPANVTVTDLGDGWSQVVMQMSVFGDVSTSSQIVFQTLDGAYAAGAVFYLTDIGFMAGSAGAGVVPEVVIYAADGAAADLAPVYDPFGSGSAFATVVDSSYANALEVTVGVGYGGGALAQLGLTQLAAGFAATYDEFVFKVKGLTADNTLLVKFEAGGGAEVQVDLTAPPANVTVTDLGDGWSQVVMQMSVFGDVSTSSQIVFQTLDGAYAAGAVFYLTDIGFMTASGGGGPGLVVNGGFDDGFTGWETFNNGGTFTIAATAGSDGGPAANLNATSPANPTIKQTLIGAGVIGPNQTFSVTFDWRGTAANGGVIAFQVFSEQTGGGVTKADLVQGGDGFPADWTTVGPLNFTSADTAAAVGDGLTLEISAICGGVAGCVSDLFIDNLVVEIVGN